MQIYFSSFFDALNDLKRKIKLENLLVIVVFILLSMIICFDVLSNFGKLNSHLNKFKISTFNNSQNVFIKEHFEGVVLKNTFAQHLLKEVNLNTENCLDTDINSEEWYIEIPSINLKANIADGTTQDILDMSVGHFDETAYIDGNVGLAAHNRGYSVNYFANIKDLQIGDLIYYSYQGKERIYIVQEKQIISETDWSNLEQTSDNKLTLITCVENIPNLRRCIQAVEQ